MVSQSAVPEGYDKYNKKRDRRFPCNVRNGLLIAGIASCALFMALRMPANSVDYELLSSYSTRGMAILSQSTNDETPTSQTTSMSTSTSTSSNDCCSKASEQSFGLFDDVSDLMWERLRQKTVSKSWYHNPQNPLEKVQDTEWWNQHNMIPNFDCPHLEFMGGKNGGHEGAKFVCNPQGLVNYGTTKEKDNNNNNNNNKDDDGCLVYSVGCAGDFKFEDQLAQMHNKGCEIHVFDPANWERKGDVENKNIHYHAWGLVSTYDQQSKSVVWPRGRGGGFKTFPETLKELGHQDRTIDLFKIDCEGCEWSSHKDWIGHGMKQILIEMHGVPTPDGNGKNRWYQKPMDLVKDYYQDFANNGYAIYSKDPNGGQGLELSFIKLHDEFWNNDNDKEEKPHEQAIVQ